jgi:hypothetical protein
MWVGPLQMDASLHRVLGLTQIIKKPVGAHIAEEWSLCAPEVPHPWVGGSNPPHPLIVAPQCVFGFDLNIYSSFTTAVGSTKTYLESWYQGKGCSHGRDSGHSVCGSYRDVQCRCLEQICCGLLTPDSCYGHLL